jgi:pimeloyl-ACP methyl ester carboxylesterase
VESAFVTVNGIRLHYYGEGRGRPVVCLHGGILDGRDFRDVLRLAAGRGYRGMAFDRPGYGLSERPRKKMTPIDQACILHRALQMLEVHKPIIVGHSWSGLLSLVFALMYPDSVSGIVLLAPAMYKEGYPAERGDPLSRLMTAPVIGDLAIRLFLKTPQARITTETMLKQTFAPETPPDGYRERVYATFLRPGQIKANREDVLAFPPAALEAAKRYAVIRHPVSVVVGENDPFGAKEQALRLKKDIPHAMLSIVPRVAHMIPQNHPELVIEAIRTIADSAEGNSGRPGEWQTA